MFTKRCDIPVFFEYPRKRAETAVGSAGETRCTPSGGSSVSHRLKLWRPQAQNEGGDNPTMAKKKAAKKKATKKKATKKKAKKKAAKKGAKKR